MPSVYAMSAAFPAASSRKFSGGSFLMRFKVTIAALLGIASAFVLPAPAAMAFTAFVTNEKDNSVSVIDTEKLEVIKTFPVGQRPRGVILSNDGKWLIICT